MTRRPRFRGLRVSAAALAAAALTGCSPGPAIDRLPSDIGLPAGAPARPPAADYSYPAVHDMPPARSDKPLSEEEQVEAERGLIAARKRQEKMTGTEAADSKEAKKKAAQTPKKKPSDANAEPAAGGKANP